jgi:hypothetical protein
LVAALGSIAALIAIGIAAAATAWSSPVLAFFEACCLFPACVVVILELRPAVLALSSCRGTATQRRTIRCFRRHLDALPETRRRWTADRRHRIRASRHASLTRHRALTHRYTADGREFSRTAAGKPTLESIP